MTDIRGTFSPVECNGDTPPESSQQTLTKINEETSDVEGGPPYYKEGANAEDLPTEENQEETEKLQDSMHLQVSMEEKVLEEKPEENLFIVHKAITDLSLQEMSADERPFREGHQWEIPVTGSNQENRQKERISEHPLGEREDEEKNKDSQATEIEWLGFQKSHQINILSSKYDEEQEVWDEEINNDNNDDDDDDGDEAEDEVREIEFKKKSEASSQFKEVGASEDSPLRSPSSQAVTPDDQPILGKKSDISRNSYSRYNTISYRKIRKGNTKQRIDEFESMMNL